MNQNLSNTDRIVRFLLFVVAIVLFAMDILSGWLAYTAVIIGTIFLLTSLMSFCPIYKVLGICTSKKADSQ